jgi:hypothetical protein
MRLLLTLSIVASLAFSAAGQDRTIQYDSFDDEDFSRNSRGVGLSTGWRTQKSGIAVGNENGGVYEVSVSKEHASHALIAPRETAAFSFWNEEGVTITWVIESIDVVTPHKFKKPFAFHWDLGVISADDAEPRWPYRACGSDKGAFFVFVGKQDAGPSCRVRVEVYNKNVVSREAHPGDPGMAQPVDYNEDLEFPLTVSATLNRHSWSVKVAEKVSSGNWTSDLAGTDRKDAAISNEFANGGFLFLHGRNSGITGTGTSFDANSGKLQSVRVELAKSPTQEK